MENEAPLSQPPQVPGAPVRPAKRWLWGLAGIGLVALGAFLTGFFVLRHTAPNGHAQGVGENNSKPNLFIGWTKPDLAIVVSGQMHGYLQPCGCSDPQKGGLARRYNFLQSLKDRGWPITAVDLGDIAQASGPQQFLKYETAMKAL